MIAIAEKIEMLRDKLHRLLDLENDLNTGEVLKLSQELDVLIQSYYKNNCSV